MLCEEKKEEWKGWLFPFVTFRSVSVERLDTYQCFIHGWVPNSVIFERLFDVWRMVTYWENLKFPNQKFDFIYLTKKKTPVLMKSEVICSHLYFHSVR